MNIKQFIAVTWQKARLNLKSETSTNYLSYGWWFLEPVIHMICYYVVFDLLMQRGGPGFVYFLLTGLVPWLWFARSISQGANSLVGGKYLMSQLYIPKLFFPLVLIVQTTIKQALVFLVFLAFLLVSGHTLSMEWSALIPILLVQLLFMLPVACLAAYAVVYIRDLKMVIPTIIQFMFFCSGIFFSFERISVEYKDWFLVNPMAGIIVAYRDVLLNNQWPNWQYLGIVALISMVLILITVLLYRSREHDIARVAQS